MKKITDERLRELAVMGAPPAERHRQTWNLLRRKPDKFDDKTGELKQEGEPHNSDLNVETVLMTDPRFESVRYNEFTGRVEFDDEVVGDHVEQRVALDMAAIYDIHVQPARVSAVMNAVARAKPYHPVRDYIAGLVWDGTPRLDTWLRDYVEAADDPWVSAMGAKWAISAVARIFDPGCKVDTVLILYGLQGARKSSAFKALSGDEWYADTTIDIKSKDALIALRGVWIYEWGEIENIKRASVTASKGFLSSAFDRYRPPYGRHTERWDRQCVIVGSTNEDQFLADSTGSRRFWCVDSGVVDLPGLEKVRDQFWAEAYVRWQQGERHYFDREEEMERAKTSDHRNIIDPWCPAVERELLSQAGTRGWVTTTDLLTNVIRRELKDIARYDEMRMADVLQALGCKKGQRIRWCGARVYPWYLPVPTDE